MVIKKDMVLKSWCAVLIATFSPAKCTRNTEPAFSASAYELEFDCSEIFAQGKNKGNNL